MKGDAVCLALMTGTEKFLDTTTENAVLLAMMTENAVLPAMMTDIVDLGMMTDTLTAVAGILGKRGDILTWADAILRTRVDMGRLAADTHQKRQVGETCTPQGGMCMLIPVMVDLILTMTEQFVMTSSGTPETCPLILEMNWSAEVTIIMIVERCQTDWM